VNLRTENILRMLGSKCLEGNFRFNLISNVFVIICESFHSQTKIVEIMSQSGQLILEKYRGISMLKGKTDNGN
jgi:hypothetical protein